MPEVVRGSSVPLFDRLVSRAGAPQGSLIVETARLRHSIRDELSRLLGTRSTLTFTQFRESGGGSLAYGIPDAGALSMRAIGDRETLRNAIEHGIALYCPRLFDVAVDVYEGAVCGADARVRICGTMRLGTLMERATFLMRSGAAVPSPAGGDADE